MMLVISYRIYNIKRVAMQSSTYSLLYEKVNVL